MGAAIIFGLTKAAGLQAQGTLLAKNPARAVIAEDLAKAYAMVEQLDADLPHQDFELDALAASQDHDTKKLCAWVDVQTRWVPYSGALRGAEGVLLERRGNSLDRALLLAELFRASGLAPQLAHANLDDDAARAVIRHARMPLAPIREPAKMRTVASASRATFKSAGARRATPVAAVVPVYGTQAIQQQTDWILANLKRAGLKIPASPFDPIESARDHWWVRLTVDDQPKDFDPDALDQKDGHFAVEPDSLITADALPDEQRQQVIAKVVIERWSAGAFSETELASVTLAPSSSGALPTLTLTHTGKDWADVDEPKDAEAALALVEKTGTWQPRLRFNEVTADSQMFDETGALVQAKDSSAAGMAGGLFGGFGGGGEDPAPVVDGVFTAEWLDFHVLVPGQPEKIIRREVVDLIGPVQRVHPPAKKPTMPAARLLQARLRLCGEVKVLVLNCRPNVMYFNHRTFARLLANRDDWLALARSPEATTDDATRLLRTGSSPDRLETFALLRGVLGDEQAYENSPGLVSAYTFPLLDEKGQAHLSELIDVAANPTVRADGDVAGVIRQGVADTAAEFHALASNRSGSTNLFALLAAQRPAENEAESFPAGATVPAKGAFEREGMARLGHEVTSGYLAVLPSRRIFPEANRFGWWRVDPATGACIGVMNSGYNQDTTEQTVVTTRGQLLLRRITDMVTRGDRQGVKELMERYGSASDMAADLGLGQEWFGVVVGFWGALTLI